MYLDRKKSMCRSGMREVVSDCRRDSNTCGSSGRCEIKCVAGIHEVRVKRKGMGSGQLSWLNVRHVTGRFRVKYPARAAGEFSSPELIFCADS